MVYLQGYVREAIIKDTEIIAIGSLNSKLVVADNSVVIVGSGRAGVLSGLTCIVISMKRPLLIEHIYCGDAVLMGLKGPIVVGSLKARRLYARKTYIGSLEADYTVLGELCIVDVLERVGEITFADPHLYLKNIKSLGKANFSYKLPGF